MRKWWLYIRLYWHMLLVKLNLKKDKDDGNGTFIY